MCYFFCTCISPTSFSDWIHVYGLCIYRVYYVVRLLSFSLYVYIVFEKNEKIKKETNYPVRSSSLNLFFLLSFFKALPQGNNLCISAPQCAVFIQVFVHHIRSAHLFLPFYFAFLTQKSPCFYYMYLLI